MYKAIVPGKVGVTPNQIINYPPYGKDTVLRVNLSGDMMEIGIPNEFDNKDNDKEQEVRTTNKRE
jgi:hypothetical protein